MAALDWLSEAIHAAANLIPRLALIRQTHRGVFFTRGTSREAKPGLHWYWPVWSELVAVCIARKTIDLPFQVLTSADGREVLVSVTVVYAIRDALQAMTVTDDITDTIRDLSQYAVKTVVSEKSIDQLRTDRTVDALLTKRLRRDLQGYGVAIRRAFLSELGAPILIRMVGGGHDGA